MSDIIRLLPDSVANQIAAGEVIQRPSSVIKELVENAIDAGASLIQVIVADAGKSSIQVVDNGKGMSPTDARLAFERHATSKISSAQDLYHLQTMGFRGEALASIAAVAQVELNTRRPEDEVGTCLRIEGSKVCSQELTGCPVGANFIVRNLFFNIPARRKFLKSNQTEMSHIYAEFERMALAHPTVGMKLATPESVLFNLPAGNFRARIKALYGKHQDAALLPLQVETSLVKISGFVGSPSSAKKKGARQFLFVNNRYMRHPYFNKAIIGAYDRLIAEGDQVPYFLSFDIDPTRIDVNVHPAKTEIKFQDDPAIWQILQAAVRESLGKWGAVPSLDFDTAGRPDLPVFDANAGPTAPPQIHIDPNFNPFGSSTAKVASGSSAPSYLPKRPSRGQVDAFSRMEQEILGQRLPTDQTPTDGNAQPTLYDTLPSDEQNRWTQTDAPRFQLLGRYVVTASSAGLLVIDQHRAHTRILFDEYYAQLTSRHGISQGLLFPQSLNLSVSAAAVFESLMPRLTAVGFDFSSLGGTDYSICGIPAGTEGLDIALLIDNLIDEAGDGGRGGEESINRHIAATLSRHAAMPCGQALSDDEMRELAQKLFASSNPRFTPSGQPIYHIWSGTDLEKLLS